MTSSISGTGAGLAVELAGRLISCRTSILEFMPATASGNVVPITAGLPGLGLKELGPMSQSIRQESSPWAWVDMTSYRASSLVFPAEIIAELDSVTCQNLRYASCVAGQAKICVQFHLK